MKRAYVFARAKRLIFIEVPAEDREPGGENKVGRLKPSLHGTRGAATNWQDEFIGALQRNGFIKGLASPCNAYYEARGLIVIVHGDGSTSISTRMQFKRFESTFDDAHECKRQRLGLDEGEETSIRATNRLMTWIEGAIVYAAGRRLVEVILKQFQIKGAKDARVAASLCTREEQAKANTNNSPEPGGHEASRYRTPTARFNYLDKGSL